MKSLRAKLFLSISTALLITALINCITSEIWIKQELKKVSVVLETHIREAQNTAQRFYAFVISYRIVDNATQLDVVGEKADTLNNRFTKESPSIWEEAINIANFDPQIAFVQIGSHEAGYAV